MNVSGVGVTPPAPQPPPVVPPAPLEGSESRGHGSGTGERWRQVPRQRQAPDGATRSSAPPLRMLTVTEMRVMLGQLPASAAVHHGSHDNAEVRQAYA